MPLVEPASSSPMNGANAPTRKCAGFHPEQHGIFEVTEGAAADADPRAAEGRSVGKVARARGIRRGAGAAQIGRQRAGGLLEIVADVELHDAEQVGGEAAIRGRNQGVSRIDPRHAGGGGNARAENPRMIGAGRWRRIAGERLSETRGRRAAGNGRRRCDTQWRTRSGDGRAGPAAQLGQFGLDMIELGLQRLNLGGTRGIIGRPRALCECRMRCGKCGRPRAGKQQRTH